MPTPSRPPPLLDDLRALPRAYWVLLSGTFINRFGTFVMPFLVIFLWKQGHSLSAASFAVSAFGVGALCGSTLGGWMADRLGRRITISAGAFAAAFFYLLLYFARPMPLVILCSALAGLAASIYPPAISALVADIVPEEQRVRAWSALRVAVNAGFACGAATAGFLAKISFFWLFLGDALTTSVFAVVALTALPHGLRGKPGESPWPEALAHIGRNRPFLLNFAAILCVSLIFSQFGTSYSADIVSLGLSFHLFGLAIRGETVYGLLIGWNGLLVMLAELPLTTITLRFEPRRTMAVGYLLLGLGFACNAFFRELPFLFAAMTLFTAGEMISSPVSNAHIARLAPARFRGRYMGVIGLSWYLSSIVGPPIGLNLIGHGHRMAWLFCGVLGAVAAALVLISRPPEDALEATESDIAAPDVEPRSLEETATRF
jgi:MFS family permease